MSNELLFEIGTEEIPAGFLSRALIDMEEIIREMLVENRIAFEGVRCLATPPVWCLYLKSARREITIEKLAGQKIALMKTVSPPKPPWFCPRPVICIQLETITTDKGEYLGVRKIIAGRPTFELLPEILKSFMLAIPFRKSMRWGARALRFARPVHWILALYGGRVVPFKIEDIESSNTSRGHRFMSPASFAVESFSDYLQKTRENFVIVDPGERKNLILAEAEKEAKAAGGKLFYDQNLLETMAYRRVPGDCARCLTQNMVATSQEYSPQPMISHQKYFPLSVRR